MCFKKSLFRLIIMKVLKFSFHPNNHKLSETLHNKGVHFVKAAREGDQKLCYLWEINVHNTNITHTLYMQCTYFETNGK